MDEEFASGLGYGAPAKGRSLADFSKMDDSVLHSRLFWHLTGAEHDNTVLALKSCGVIRLAIQGAS
jgi:hypothetical protein